MSLRFIASLLVAVLVAVPAIGAEVTATSVTTEIGQTVTHGVAGPQGSQVESNTYTVTSTGANISTINHEVRNNGPATDTYTIAVTIDQTVAGAIPNINSLVFTFVRQNLSGHLLVTAPASFGGLTSGGIVTVGNTQTVTYTGPTQVNLSATDSFSVTIASPASVGQIQPTTFTFSLAANAVPEPGTMALAGIGLVVGGGSWTWRRRRKQRSTTPDEARSS